MRNHTDQENMVPSNMSTTKSFKHALVICDVQKTLLNSLPFKESALLVHLLQILIHVAAQQEKESLSNQTNNVKIVWSGLAFSEDYHEISTHHKLYGALRRLYQAQSKAITTTTTAMSSWLVKGEPLTQFAPELWKTATTENNNSNNNNCTTIWRSSHMPNTAALYEALEGCTHVTVVGIKTGFAIQSTIQVLCDWNSLIQVSYIPECIWDDDFNRHQTILNHVLPCYATRVSMAEWLDDIYGLEQLPNVIPKNLGSAITTTTTIATNHKDMSVQPRFLLDCGRGGHAFLYMQNLIKQQHPQQQWCLYPSQPWYTDDNSFGCGGSAGKSYICPLGKQILEFCDEPQFSKISMYIKGREWLDEKEKLVSFASQYMPRTFLIENQRWRTGLPGFDDNAIVPLEKDNGDDAVQCCFVKECDKNGGKAIQLCGNVRDALTLCEPNSRYVVQKHIANPLLTKSGHKCHVKAYFLLRQEQSKWHLYIYPEAFLCVATVPWSISDLSHPGQVTIKRTIRLYKEKPCPEWNEGWPFAYESCCKTIVDQVVEQAVLQGKLTSRENIKKSQDQFEIFSADILVDTNKKGWLIECNFGCVLFDPTIGQPLTTAGLKEYQRLYDLYGGEAVAVNDHEMLLNTLAMIFDGEEETKWEKVGSYCCENKM